MKFSEAYKGAFFKASDVQKKPIRLTIEEIAEEEVGGEPKLVVHFEETEQLLVLNKTNGSILAEKWADDMEIWYGKQILLKADKTQFSGKLVACIRVEPVDKKATKAAPDPKQGNDDVLP